MYVLLYLPQGADPEVFGPFSTPQHAINILRRIASAAGEQIDISHSALLATIDVSIDDELHRYQLLKLGSSDQLDAHAYVIEAERQSSRVTVATKPVSQPPPSRLSGY